MKKETKMGMTPQKAAEVFQSNNESKLKKVRVSKGFSQQDLSDASGVKKRVIQTYEQGERNINNAWLSNLCSICVVLGCKITDILEDEALIEKFNKCK